MTLLLGSITMDAIITGTLYCVGAAPRVVGRCRLTLSKPVLKAPVVSALEATI
jgi:hypothetical protein